MSVSRSTFNARLRRGWTQEEARLPIAVVMARRVAAVKVPKRWNGARLRPIPDCHGYFVSDRGHVVSMVPSRMHMELPHELKVNWTRCGGKKPIWYARVVLCVSGKRVKKFVHRAILEAFRGHAPAGKNVCRHMDGNSRHNLLSNLRWGTQVQNASDTVRHGRSMRGERSSLCRTSTKTARVVVRMLRAGRRSCDIVRATGASESVVYHIRAGNSWKHLSRAA